MYKFLQIPNFAKAGLNSDLMPWDLDGSYLTDISNVRIRDGKILPFGGYRTWTDLPTGFFPGFLMHVGSTSGEFWIIAGRGQVLSWDGALFSDISSVGGYPGVNDEDLWQGCMLSRIPIINSPQHYPEYWSPQNGGIDLQPLPWDASNTWEDVGETARIIRSHKQYLFAMDLQSGANEYQDGVRWSAPADIGGLPSTWDPLDITNVAGLTNLGGDGGRIIDGLSLKDAFAVYRESGITMFDYVGGNFVWRVRNLSSTIGMIAPDSIIEVKGVHYLIGDGDILMNDGNTIQSMLHNRIRERFISDYNPETYLNSYAIRNNASSEVWFCIPSTEAIYPDTAYVFNWRDNTWAIRDIPEGPFGSYGAVPSVPITWENIPGIYDNSQGRWAQRQATPLSDTIVITIKPEDVGSEGKLVFPDRGNIGGDIDFASSLERVGFALEGLNNVTTITRIYPHMRGPDGANVSIQIGSQDFPGAPIRWKDVVDFNPEADRKVDIRTTGELHCFRIFDSNVDGAWEISGLDIEYVMAGVR